MPHREPRVLVAEDEAVSRTILETVLGRAGYAVETTDDGLEAWRRLSAKGAPQLAVLDWVMPGLDGVEVCRRLREQHRVDPPYVILVTSRDSTEDIVRGLEAGANDYLAKPFDASELLARVQVGGRYVRLQQRLAGMLQRQKLEAVGQLAAGIAHEINTPIQFVGDSLSFVRDACDDLFALIAAYRGGIASLPRGKALAALRERLEEAEDDADLAYLSERLPSAFERTAEGLARVAEIVRAMKEFAYPEQKEMAPADLNGAIRTTLTIARSEVKHVADVELDLGEVPEVVCHIGDVNQVLLNLVVNAAHAIADREGDGGRGTITVRTRALGGAVEVAVADTGTGIAPDVQARIFDPFFTTKQVGRGSGQGLAIARNIVVNTHGGELTFETEPGRGTTFVVRLPLAPGGAGAV